MTEQLKISYSGNQLWGLWKCQLKKNSSRNSSKSDVSWLKALAKAKFETAKTRLRFTGSTNSRWRGQSETRKKLNYQLELLAQQRETAALEEANAFDALDQESQLSWSLLPNTEHVDPYNKAIRRRRQMYKNVLTNTPHI